MARSASLRRRQAGVLLVGATEPEVGSWLHAAGHATRTVPGADAALAALGEEPADLVIADREPDGLDVPAVCLALREDPRLGSAWLLAITTPARGGISDVGADDYLHRPFTRVQLLARARTGLRAVNQRSDDALLRSLMATVPGAIYRSAWHAGHRLELITDEIERISGYPADNFIASSRRTLLSIIHPATRTRSCARWRPRATRSSRSRRSTGSCARTARSATCSTAASWSAAPAGGSGWTA